MNDPPVCRRCNLPMSLFPAGRGTVWQCSTCGKVRVPRKGNKPSKVDILDTPEEVDMGAGERVKYAHDVRAYRQSVVAASKRGPLQSLTDRELGLRDNPVTVYPRNAQRRVKAWVRFGPEAIRVDAVLVRTTDRAAGIEFKAEGQTWRCWIWSNAVELDEAD